MADVATVRGWLAASGEIAFVDVREEGQHGAGHPLLAVNIPYSRLERDFPLLVPRRTCRVVLVDDADGVAAKAKRRLAALGYAEVDLLAGGTAAWEAAGHRLFPSSNVPSKAFAEIIEHDCATPAISAAELDRLRRADTPLVVLDSRPADEYARFHVPGAVTCPGAELVHRFSDLVPAPETLVVVSCAGRTRGIIGAQSLINAGVPNRVMSLAGGTQGWRLAGFELERGATTALAPVSAAAAEKARSRAAAVAARYGIPQIDRASLDRWLGEGEARTTFVLDVRTPEEFAAGHLPGSLSAPGGQLVQAIDRWVGIRGARLVLVDDNGVRAIMTAHWLGQMGWDVQVLDDGLGGPPLAVAAMAELAALGEIDAAAAARLMAAGAAAVSLEASAAYRAGHPPGAAWAIRPRLERLPAAVFEARQIILFAADPATARLAAVDLRELGAAEIAAVHGGTAAWRTAGLPLVASPEQPPDGERIDYVFWNHDRHDGNRGAMEAYLRWETELPAQIAADGQAGFRPGSAAH